MVNLASSRCICLGLRYEDLYDEEEKDTAAALKMLPDKENDLRMYRLRRAMDLSLKHAILPEDQWTKPEEVRRWLATRPLRYACLYEYLSWRSVKRELKSPLSTRIHVSNFQ